MANNYLNSKFPSEEKAEEFLVFTKEKITARTHISRNGDLVELDVGKIPFPKLKVIMKKREELDVIDD